MMAKNMRVSPAHTMPNRIERMTVEAIPARRRSSMLVTPSSRTVKATA